MAQVVNGGTTMAAEITVSGSGQLSLRRHPPEANRVGNLSVVRLTPR